MKLFLLAAAVTAGNKPIGMDEICKKNQKEYSSSRLWVKERKIVPIELKETKPIEPASFLSECDSDSSTPVFLLKQKLTRAEKDNFYYKLKTIDRLQSKNFYPVSFDCYRSEKHGYLIAKKMLPTFTVYYHINSSFRDRLKSYLELAKQVSWFNKHRIVLPFWGMRDVSSSSDGKLFIFNLKHLYRSREKISFYLDTEVPPEVAQALKSSGSEIYTASVTKAWNEWRLLKFIAEMESYAYQYGQSNDILKERKTDVYEAFSKFIEENFKSTDNRGGIKKILHVLQDTYVKLGNTSEEEIKKEAINH